MQAGDFYLVQIHGPGGWLIRLGQALTGDWSRYCHAGIILDDGTALAAHPGGATIDPLDEILYDRPLAVSHYDLTLKEQAAVVAAARSYRGRPYSILDYLSLAAVTFHVRPRWLLNYIAGTGHMICSQLVDQCYLDAGVNLFDDGRFAGDVTPGDLAYVGTIENIGTGPFVTNEITVPSTLD